MKITSKLVRSILEEVKELDQPKKPTVLLNYRKFLTGEGLRAISAKITKSEYGSVSADLDITGKYGGESRSLFNCYGPSKDSLDELDAIQTAIRKIRNKLAKEVK